MERKTGARGLRAIMVGYSIQLLLHSMSVPLFISVESLLLTLTYLLSVLEDKVFSTLLGR
jgi:ATP-dependent protease Clp ATPase subunit